MDVFYIKLKADWFTQFNLEIVRILKNPVDLVNPVRKEA